MNSKNLKIDNDNSERRLDNYLFSIYKSLPKSKIYSMIRKGEVRVNSKRIKPSYKLKSEDEIRIPPYLINYREHLIQVKIPQKRIDIYKKSVLFENHNYVVINKEAELSVHSGSKNSFGLIDIVRVINPNLDIDLCHRIDKTTSGCIVLSKNKKFLRNFHMQLKNNSVKKTYKAILAGSFEGKINTKSNIKKTRIIQISIDPWFRVSDRKDYAYASTYRRRGGTLVELRRVKHISNKMLQHWKIMICA